MTEEGSSKATVYGIAITQFGYLSNGSYGYLGYYSTVSQTRVVAISGSPIGFTARVTATYNGTSVTGSAT